MNRLVASAVVSTRLAACLLAGGLALGGCTSGDKIGVVECDDYLEKARKCSEKGGPGEALKMSNDMLKKSWAKTMTESGQKAMLPITCRAALEGARKAYTACEW